MNTFHLRDNKFLSASISGTVFLMMGVLLPVAKQMPEAKSFLAERI